MKHRQALPQQEEMEIDIQKTQSPEDNEESLIYYGTQCLQLEEML